MLARYTLPLHIRQYPNALAVMDASARTLATIYYESDEARRKAGRLMSYPEAHDVAQAIAAALTARRS